MPYDIMDWLPEGHPGRFVAAAVAVDMVEQLGLCDAYRQYQGRGKAAYDPRLLISLLFYGYATGVFSSRKLESATYDSVVFRFIAGNLHPDHDRATLAPLLPSASLSFLRLRAGSKIFYALVRSGRRRMNLVWLGNIYVDGTKIQASASRIVMTNTLFGKVIVK